MTEFDWNQHTWDVIDLPFKDPDFLVSHQISSFDNFMTDTLPRLVQINSPIIVEKDQHTRYELRITRVYVSRPVQHNTDTGYQPLYPHEARCRDLTYAAPVFIDYEQIFTQGGTRQVETEQKVPLFKMPIMLGSKYCHLYGKTQSEREILNECIYDRGGYFIVNGSEKVVIAQERPVDNKIMLFKEGASSTHSYVARAEVKSTIDQRFYPIKPCSVLLSKTKTGAKAKSAADHVPGQKLEVVIPHIKPPKSKNGIPLFIVFRALGVVSDKDIFEYILGNTETASNDMINLLIPSAHETSSVITQLDAINYIAQNVNFMPTPGLSEEEYAELKLQYTKDIINREFLSHVGQDNIKKAAFLACMTRKLLSAIIDPSLFSDRDHYSNKRVDLTGPLLSQIVRYNFQRLVRDIKQSFVKELEGEPTGGKLGINPNIRKIIQKCTIESRVKYALSTGNWHTTRAHASSESKKGIAQVLQRLSWLGTLAHTRRVQSPLERAGSKHEPPRRYHPTQLGKICPNETPEGQQVGIVKNLSLLCHVTIECSSYPVRWILSKLGITEICKANPKVVPVSTTVFVNGDLVGIVDKSVTDPEKVYRALKMFKLNGKIGEYTSISWCIETNELVINTDGGRYCRPLYVIDANNRFKLDHWTEHFGGSSALSEKIKSGEITWDHFKRGLSSVDGSTINDKTGAMIEFVDTNEDECSLIAIIPQQLVPGRVHKISGNKVLAKMGYVGSRFSLKDIETPEDAHDYIKSKLAEEYHEMWDQVVVSKIVNNVNSILELTLPASASESLKVFVSHINKFVYNEFVRYTHCELHAAMWHSVVAQMIPFPDHNQSPRNCYQCLDKNELVLMSSGEFKKISDISVGDSVISVNPKTMERKNVKVINQYVKKTDKKIVNLTTISGRTVVCTDDHPVLALLPESSDPQWVKAGDLTSFDKIAVCPLETDHISVNEYDRYISTAEFGRIMSYNEWCARTKLIGNSIFVPVSSVIEDDDEIEIADITVDDDTHSFITGNCICVHNSSMGKQALGVFATNYAVRVDTMANVLTYAQKPLVQTRTAKYTNLDKLPHGNQAIVAIQVYTGYNQEDSVLGSRRAFECGMFNSVYYRTYTNKLQKHKTANTAPEQFGIPPEEDTMGRRIGTSKHDRYHAIDKSTGRPQVGVYVHEDDILISKYKKAVSDVKGKILYDDVSTLAKEPGVIDMIIPNAQFPNNENAEGYPFIKARVSNLRTPIIGDKLASRSAQKGTIGMIYSPEDMPCTAEGIVPDIIMNPHAIPSRMTIAQLIESILGKAAVLSGRTRDATPFTEFNIDEVKAELDKYGFDYNGNEVMYNGQTGEMFEAAIFINPTYYQRLKHMVDDKIHSREMGPVQLLTRQPAEGRSRDGGLRIGEMERDCFIAHGAAQYQKEKMNESSDIFRVYVSRDKGNLVSANPEYGIYRSGLTDIYEDEEVVPVNMPFAMSLLLNEMKTILIDPVLETD